MTDAFRRLGPRTGNDDATQLALRRKALNAMRNAGAIAAAVPPCAIAASRSGDGNPQQRRRNERTGSAP
jgi:hypothetical protein